ncbi:alpha/beta hydrolase [Nocardia vermiculata]|uniref:Alpha/beta hydrolase n=1 Tax=Nocardia vermiculata TaxID=257274 RepID=A0A846XW65_9NOCA|nr:alpha/beta fold hydrolase [Nocardia vermiculata]NKY51373.1 alpha/beta hydrolase [Nocardia vermiculata]
MTRTPLDFAVGGRRISGIATDSGAAETPLVIALHGGGYNHGYFDVPGHSLLDIGSAAGFSVFALDRPDYGGSDPLPEGRRTFDDSATALCAAIGTLWATHGENRPGVVLLAHSIGAAIAVHIAARRPDWPLLGISIHGVSDRSPDYIVDTWKNLPASGPVELAPNQLRGLLYGPERTVEVDIVELAKGSVEPVSREEMLEIVGRWPNDVARLAASVVVPVQYTLAEHDGLWIVDKGRVANFARYFTSAPWVDAKLQADAGHNLDHHRLSHALHLRQSAFASECATRATVAAN